MSIVLVLIQSNGKKMFVIKDLAYKKRIRKFTLRKVYGISYLC